jgi:putative ABC transport system permease protein
MRSQIVAVTAMNLKSLPQRLGNSFVIIIGMAGVVGVLVCVLGMTQSLQRTMLATGEPDRAVVLRGGSRSDVASALPLDAVATIMAAPGVARTADGEATVSAEMVTAVNLLRKADGSRAGVSVRGVGPQFQAVRPEINLVEGRMFQPGLRELIAGRGVHAQFQGVGLGDRVALRDSEWTIVGVFGSNDAFESALLTDVDTLRSAYRRAMVNAVTVQLESPEDFKGALTSNPTLSVNAMRETDYYREQSRGAQGLLRFVTTFVVGIMSIGAMLAALNTMSSAVEARTVEIATLRAIGFGAGGIVVSVLTEALLLATTGALLGAGVAWLFFHGMTISVGGVTGSTVFALTVNAQLLSTGMLLACSVGILGGLLPALRSARVPVAQALKAA